MERTVTFVLVALIACSGSVGCKRRSSSTRVTSVTTPTTSAPAVVVTAPPTPVWKENSLEFKELPRARGDFLVDKTLAYKITFSGLPEGATLRVGNNAQTGGFGIAQASVDLADTIAALRPADAFDYAFRIDPHATATLNFPGGVESSLALPAMSLSYGLTERLKTCADAPVTFGSNDGANPAAHTIVYVGGTTPDVIGPAKRVMDIDLVALEEKSGTRTGKICSGYKKTGAASATSDEKSYPLTMVDQKVTVYERTTSKAVASREFRAKQVCPMMTFNDQATSYPDRDEIKAWLRSVRGTTR